MNVEPQDSKPKKKRKNGHLVHIFKDIKINTLVKYRQRARLTTYRTIKLFYDIRDCIKSTRIYVYGERINFYLLVNYETTSPVLRFEMIRGLDHYQLSHGILFRAPKSVKRCRSNLTMSEAFAALAADSSTYLNAAWLREREDAWSTASEHYYDRYQRYRDDGRMLDNLVGKPRINHHVPNADRIGPLLKAWRSFKAERKRLDRLHSVPAHLLPFIPFSLSRKKDK